MDILKNIIGKDEKILWKGNPASEILVRLKRTSIFLTISAIFNFFFSYLCFYIIYNSNKGFSAYIKGIDIFMMFFLEILFFLFNLGYLILWNLVAFNLLKYSYNFFLQYTTYKEVQYYITNEKVVEISKNEDLIKGIRYFFLELNKIDKITAYPLRSQKGSIAYIQFDSHCLQEKPQNCYNIQKKIVFTRSIEEKLTFKEDDLKLNEFYQINPENYSKTLGGSKEKNKFRFAYIRNFDKVLNVLYSLVPTEKISIYQKVISFWAIDKKIILLSSEKQKKS